MTNSQRRDLSQRCRADIERARERLGERLAAGVAGQQACAGLSDAYDEVVAGLWSSATSRVQGADVPLALVATGGWGRREICPYSDIDFIVLSRPRDRDAARKIADELLYPMWDSGFKVGHAVRDPAGASKLARDDLATATSLIDARIIAGDRALGDKLMSATRNVIAPGGNPNRFIQRLAEEKRRRHERFGASLYLLEPNLKHGIGGLRDLATAIWAARARWSVRDISSLVTMGQLSSRQVAVLRSGLDFLLELRSLLQLQAGRATDQLTFEVQEAIAPLRYPGASSASDGGTEVTSAVAPAVETLMRHFYLHARRAVQIADRLLEAATVPARRRPTIVRVDGTFVIFNGKLSVHDPASFRDRPAEMLRLFRVALERDVPVYGHTLERITEAVPQLGDRLTRDPDAARHLREAIVDPRDGRQPSLLAQMHQVGLLSAVMPEFGPCTCRVQHDLYHVYTVDQHLLYTLAMLKRLARGELAAEAPLATSAIAEVTRREPLFLATLLHDVGKPLGKDHSIQGALQAVTVAERLAFSEQDVATTDFLVRNHLLMSQVSQRRDLGDLDVIERFAGQVGDDEKLIMLYLLSRCDTAMTAPGNLTSWKDQLLGELFSRTRSWFAEDASGAPEEPGERARDVSVQVIEGIAARLDGDEAEREAERVAAFLSGIDAGSFAALTPHQVRRLVRLADKRAKSGAIVELRVASKPMKGHTELAIVADDRPGLLAILAGAMTAHRVSIDGAVVCVREPAEPGGVALALDHFYVRDPAGHPIRPDDKRWARLRAELESAVQKDVGDSSLADLIARRRPPSVLERRVTPGVATEVCIINDQSAEFTVVEVFTQDRVGVLYAITRTMAELGLDIHLSKISTEGEKAADVFYVNQRESQEKVGDEEVEQLRSALEAALAAVGQDE